MKNSLKEKYHLVWSDVFDYDGQPNPEKWICSVGNHQWANNELQAYTDNPQNVSVKDGRLTISAFKQKDGDRGYTSSRITTSGKQSWQYGYFEVRAKLPRGKGSWPAIWMLPDSIKNGTPWPECGEIDIVEHVGRKENVLLFSLHSQRHNHTRKDTAQYTTFLDYQNVCDEYHTYAIEWTSEYIEFYVDDTSVCKYSKTDDKEDQTEQSWPFDQPFYLILNIAVGGGLGGPVNNSSLPYIMDVEYVKVYQKKTGKF